jgi:hypothetical protein
MTSTEKRSGYKHSHLSSGSSSDYQFSLFCLGSSSSIAFSLTELSINFTLERFELFLYELSAYVKYESLEGGPFIRMENIGKYGNQHYGSENSEGELKRFFTKILLNNIGPSNDKIVLPIEYDMLKKQYVLNSHNEGFLRELAKVSDNPHVKNSQGDFVSLRTIDTEYSPSVKEEVNKPIFNLPDGEVFFKIEDPKLKEVKEHVLYPSPTLVNFTKKEIEKDLNLFYTLKKSYEFS